MSIALSLIAVLYCFVMLGKSVVFSLVTGLVIYVVISAFLEFIKISFLQRKLPWKHSKIANMFLILQVISFKLFIWLVIMFAGTYGFKAIQEMQKDEGKITATQQVSSVGQAPLQAPPLKPINRQEITTTAENVSTLPTAKKFSVENFIFSVAKHQNICINIGAMLAGIFAATLLRFLFSGLFWGLYPLNGYKYSFVVEKVQGKKAEGILRAFPSAGLWNSGLLNRIIVNVIWRHKILVDTKEFPSIQKDTEVFFSVSEKGIVEVVTQ